MIGVRMNNDIAASSLRPARVRATPKARRAMRDRGLDPSRVAGHGPNGRIVVADVETSTAGRAVRRPLGSLRKIIARRLVFSKQTVPHFYVRQTIHADQLAAHYAACKSKFPCSLNDLVLQAVARVVAEFPAFRSRLEGDELVEAPDANIGVAVGLDDGLVVPAVLHADRLGLRELAVETRRVADLARLRRIENSGEGVFTVTNLGMYGTEEFSAIINPPESAILAVGTMREEALAHEGMLYAGKVVSLTLSCDHRIIDGMCAAQFMRRLKEILESPGQFLN